MTSLIKIEKLSLSCILFYYYAKLIGLCPFALDRNGILKSSRCGILYSIVLSLLYLIIFIRGMVEKSKVVIPNDTIMSKICDGLVVILQFSMIELSWGFFGLRQRRIQQIFEEFKTTTEIAKELGIFKDSCKIVKPFYIISLNFCYFILFSSTLEIYEGFPSYNVKIWGPFFVPHVVFHNVLALFVIAMHIMHWGFQRLNLQLRNLPVRKLSINLFISRKLEFR